jgi:neopullulanase
MRHFKFARIRRRPMNLISRAVRLGVVAVVVFAPAIVSAGQRAETSAAPRVTRLEPPNWWAGFSPDFMLLITGENLQGAKLETSARGVTVKRVESRPNGHYVFGWLHIESGAEAGKVPLELVSPSGQRTEVDFPLLPPRAAAGNFQGISTDDVIYLIMPDRFADGDASNDAPPQSPGTFDRKNPRAYHGGDLKGVRDHLDYLHDLGVTTLWLTPFVDNDNHSPQDYHGYGAVDEYAVDEHFGTLAELQQLVSDAHHRQMKVFFDMVPNHLGPKHPWVDDPPDPDWFHGTRAHHLRSRGGFEGIADPHAPPKFWREMEEGWFGDVLPDLNQDNPRTAEYLIDNALWWAETTGVDGYRLDTFPYVSRRFWPEWHRALHLAFPNFSTIGEIFNGDVTLTSFFVGGRVEWDGIDSGLTTCFDFPFYFALRDVVIHGAGFERLTGVLGRDFLYPHPELLVPFLGNHDVERFVSEQGSSPQQLKLAFSLLLTMRGIPEIYSGDEIAMPGGGDPDNRRDFPGGFPGDAHNAFLESGRTPEEQDVFAHVRTLLHLRGDHPSLRHGTLVTIAVEHDLYAFARLSSEEHVLVVANNSAAEKLIKLSFDDTPLAGATRLVPLMGGRAQDIADDSVSVTVPARTAIIFKVQ